MKRKNIIIIASLMTLTLTGCSLTSITDRFLDPETLNARLHQSPRFKYDLVELEGYSNLSQLSSEFFQGKPYNDILNFGDNILLVGEGIYTPSIGDQIEDAIDEKIDNIKDENSTEASTDTSTDTSTEDNGDEFYDDDSMGDEGEGWMDEGDIQFQFSFVLYNPWANQIVAELKYEDIKCDSYQVTGDQLILTDSSSHTATIYDSQLQLLGSYNTEDIDSVASSIFYRGIDGNLYTTDYNNSSVYKISEKDFSMTAFELDLYNPSISCTSPDGKYMLISGVTKDTLRNTIHLVDTSDFSTLYTEKGTAYATSCVENNGYIYEYDSEYNEWCYQGFDNSKMYFALKDTRNARLLPDGSFVIQQESYYDESDPSDHSASFYHIDKEGNTLSQFTYQLPPDQEGNYTYFSNHCVYLSDCNCMIYLVYNQGVSPKVLVWDLNNTEEATNFKLCTSSEPDQCLDDVDVASVDSEYTLIPDLSNYDWGELKEANDRATALENKYKIEIFLGEEVPAELSGFKCEQLTSQKEVNDALDALEKMLGYYPDNFFDQLVYGNIEGIRFYLAGDLSGDDPDNISDPAAYVSEMNDYMIMVLDSTYVWGWNDTFNHEMSHIIDRRLETLARYDSDYMYSEETWNSYNPKDYEYSLSYANYEKDNFYDSDLSKYFISDYGTTFPTEDRAQIFGRAVDDYITQFPTDYTFEKDSPKYKKLKYYCECIRAGFNTTGWDKVEPWEYILGE